VKGRTTDGFLLHTQQQVEEETYCKWILAFGGDTSVVIYATAEKSEFEKLSDTLKETLLKAKWDPDAKISLLEGLAFSMDEAGDLKFAFNLSGGVILTRDGVHPLPDPGMPLVLASSAADPQFTPELDPKDYAHALLVQTGKITDAKVIMEEKPIAVDGHNGYLVTAKGRQEGVETDFYFYHAAVLTDGRLFNFHGRVALENQAQYKPVFDELLKSIALNK